MTNNIGIIGLGNIGGRLASRLKSLQYPVIGFDSMKTQGEKWGIDIVSVEELAKISNLIMLSLPNSKIIEQVALGRDGLINFCKPGTVIIDLSTADPMSSTKIYSALKEKNIHYLDIGISGGPFKAADGTLTLMAGGDENVFNDCLPVLNQIAEKIYYMGVSGKGHMMKAINNFLNGINLLATSEAMIMAKKANLDLSKVLQVFNESSGQNYATSYRFPRIINGDYIEGGLTSHLMIKDLDVYCSLARSLSVPVLVGDMTNSIFNLAVGLNKGHMTSNYIVDVLGDLAGGVRVNGARGDDDYINK